jgi:DNA mismatch repair ATPase MutS
MLDVATPRTLVFIDELGRGTEATHGTAMAGAVIEALDKVSTLQTRQLRTLIPEP